MGLGEIEKTPISKKIGGLKNGEQLSGNSGQLKKSAHKRSIYTMKLSLELT